MAVEFSESATNSDARSAAGGRALSELEQTGDARTNAVAAHEEIDPTQTPNSSNAATDLFSLGRASEAPDADGPASSVRPGASPGTTVSRFGFVRRKPNRLEEATPPFIELAADHDLRAETFYQQQNFVTCGIASVRMLLADLLGENISEEQLCKDSSDDFQGFKPGVGTGARGADTLLEEHGLLSDDLVLPGPTIVDELDRRTEAGGRAMIAIEGGARNIMEGHWVVAIKVFHLPGERDRFILVKDPGTGAADVFPEGAFIQPHLMGPTPENAHSWRGLPCRTKLLANFADVPRARDEDDELIRALFEKTAIDPQIQDRIHRFLETLDDKEMRREAQLLRKALDGRNPTRSIKAYDLLLQKMAESDVAKQRITPLIRRALTMGVSDVQSRCDRGREGVLGVVHVHFAAKHLIEMSNIDYGCVTHMLEAAARGVDKEPHFYSDAAAERSLILKAVGAINLPPESGTAPNEISAAIAEVLEFSREINGVARKTLMTKTTVIDIDDENTSLRTTGNVLSLSDLLGDNDGLYQRPGFGCAPTTAQIVACEANPMKAWKFHKQGIDDPSVATELAMEQERVLFGAGGGGGNRLADAVWRTIQTLIGGAAAKVTLPAEELVALVAYSRGLEFNQENLDRAIARIREVVAGFPTAGDVEALRHAHLGSEGGGGMPLEPALWEIAAPVTHLNWSGRGFEQLQSVDQIANHLEAGHAIPIRIADEKDNGGHFMCTVDVRGPKEQRDYLVADPWTGKATWSTQQEICDGSFLQKFGWPPNFHIAHYYIGLE